EARLFYGLHERPTFVERAGGGHLGEHVFSGLERLDRLGSVERQGRCQAGRIKLAPFEQRLKFRESRNVRVELPPRSEDFFTVIANGDEPSFFREMSGDAANRATSLAADDRKANWRFAHDPTTSLVTSRV